MDDLALNFDVATPAHTGPFKRTRQTGRWADRTKLKQTLRRKSKPEVTRTISEPVQSPSEPREEVIAEPEEPVARSAGQRNPSIKKPRKFISSLFSSVDRLAEPVTSIQDLQAVSNPSNAPPADGSFASFSLLSVITDRLQHASLALERPTAVQKLAIPAILSGHQQHDFLLQAQTGSGKTLAYILPIVHDLLLHGLSLQKQGVTLDRSIGTFAIVLVPTRELAQQVYQVALNLLAFARHQSKGKGKAGEEVADVGEEADVPTQWLIPGLLSGGMHRQHEKARLRKGVPLLIATPGRLLDHLETTRSFRLAGDKQGHMYQAKASNDFEIEDQPFEGVQDDGISSDEDFTNKPRAKSYRPRFGQKKSSDVSTAATSLRWLVLDEADRLLDMGFGPQVEKVVAILRQRQRAPADAHRIWSTILCSATVEGALKQFAGSLLKNPITIEGDKLPPGETAPIDDEEQHTMPSQLAQSYIVVPPKLRFVTLISLLRTCFSDAANTKSGDDGHKALIFLSCIDVVDFYFRAFDSVNMGHAEEAPTRTDESRLAAKSVLLGDVSIYRLHGNMDMQTRINSLKAFAKDDKAVLLCTSLAARGIDIPFVRYVIQYDLPTEGGLKEYIHRVGRTARAGQSGEAWAFLLPSEEAWVERAREHPTLKGSNIKPVGVASLLQSGLGGKKHEFEDRATDVQMAFERWIESSAEADSMAKSAFSSHVRAYATHSADEKSIFHVKNLHLGHLAKSFGLREAPAGLGKIVSSSRSAKPAAAPKPTGKRKRPVQAEIDRESEASDNGGPIRKKLPRTGRATAGKPMRAINSNNAEFAITSTADLEKMLQRR